MFFYKLFWKCFGNKGCYGASAISGCISFILKCHFSYRYLKYCGRRKGKHELYPQYGSAVGRPKLIKIITNTEYKSSLSYSSLLILKISYTTLDY